MGRIEDLVAFTAIADSGGMAAAGQRTGLPRSALSRRLRRLEAELGVQLAKRSPQSFALTPVGEALYARCREGFAILEGAQAELAGALTSPRGPVRVTCPTPIAHRFLVRELVSFCQAYPDVWVSIDVNPTKLHLAVESFDLALRVGNVAGDHQVARLLFREREAIYGAAALAPELRGNITQPEELASQSAIFCTNDLAGPPSRLVRLTNGTETREIEMPVRLRVNDPMAGVSAGEAGLGLVNLPRFVGDRAVDMGTLVRVLPTWASPEIEVRAVLPQRPTVAVRALLDHLVIAARKQWRT
jgi:DNA-binding transcriptional LysR family regulator